MPVSQEPFNLELPKTARKLVRATNLTQLRLVTTRLEAITANYNHALRSMSGFEKPLLDRQLEQIEQVSTLNETHAICRLVSQKNCRL